jgi:hypothetical protein
MNFESDVHNFLDSDIVRIIMAFLTVQVFLWTYILFWSFWELWDYAYDPNLCLFNHINNRLCLTGSTP